MSADDPKLKEAVERVIRTTLVHDWNHPVSKPWTDTSVEAAALAIVALLEPTLSALSSRVDQLSRIPGELERVKPLATDELGALQEKWPRIYAAVVAAEQRAEAAERRLSQAEEGEPVAWRYNLASKPGLPSTPYLSWKRPVGPVENLTPLYARTFLNGAKP